MDAAWEESKFVDFGNDLLLPFKRVATAKIHGQSADDLRKSVRSAVPRCPGVYGMLDVLGRLIYVGKSKCLRSRLLSYFLPHNEDDKAGRIVQSAVSIVWESQPSEFAALLREQFLIRHWQPRFNVQGLPKRQRPIFVCLGRAPVEQLFTSRQPEPKALVCVGPFQGASRAAQAVDVLNRFFKLRDCSSKLRFGFSDQLQLFDIERRPGCIRYEIQTCLGPCIEGCSRTAYESQIREARRFLEGSDARCVDILEEQMLAAVKRQHFEQAARLREDWRAVAWLSRRVADLAVARHEFTFVYPVDGVEGKNIWYLIRRGAIEGSITAPRTPLQRQRAQRMIVGWLAAENTVGSRFSERPETLALVTSWFRNHRAELKRTLQPDSIATDAFVEV